MLNRKQKQAAIKRIIKPLYVGEPWLTGVYTHIKTGRPLHREGTRRYNSDLEDHWEVSFEEVNKSDMLNIPRAAPVQLSLPTSQQVRDLIEGLKVNLAILERWEVETKPALPKDFRALALEVFASVLENAPYWAAQPEDKGTYPPERSPFNSLRYLAAFHMEHGVTAEEVMEQLRS